MGNVVRGEKHLLVQETNLWIVFQSILESFSVTCCEQSKDFMQKGKHSEDKAQQQLQSQWGTQQELGLLFSVLGLYTVSVKHYF